MRENASILALAAIFIFPSIGGLLFGFDIGATAYVLIQLQSNEYAGVEWSADIIESSVLRGFLTSSVVGGALFGTLIIFRIENGLGRRRELLIAATCYILGGMLEFISYQNSLGRLWGLITICIGRWVYGIGCGFAMHGAPAYIAEM